MHLDLMLITIDRERERERERERALSYEAIQVITKEKNISTSKPHINLFKERNN